MGFIVLDMAREPPCDGPQRTGIQCFEEHRVRHQPGHTAVAIEKQVHPQQPMMRRCRGENRIGGTQTAIRLLKACEESRYSTRTDRYVLADFDITRAQRTGNDLAPLVRVWVLDPEQRLRQQLAKVPMDLAEALDRGAAALESTGINPTLDRDMGPRFELQVPLLRVPAIVVPERALDINWVGVVPFNQIAIVAIHGTHEIGQSRQDAVGEAASESGRLRCQRNGQISQRSPVTGT